MTATMNPHAAYVPAINPHTDPRPIGIFHEEPPPFDNTPYLGKRFVVLTSYLGRFKTRGDVISPEQLPHVDFARLIGLKAIRLANRDEEDKDHVEVKSDEDQHLSWDSQLEAKNRQIEGLQKQLTRAGQELVNANQLNVPVVAANVQAPSPAILNQIQEKDKTIESLKAQAAMQSQQIANLSAQLQQMQESNGGNVNKPRK